MTPTERQALVRQYAEGRLSWHALRERGVEDYVEVLADLADLGMRPPVTPLEGPNRAARERELTILRAALRRRPGS